MSRRAFSVAATDPSLVAFASGGALILGRIGAVRVCERDPVRALDAFAAECDRPRDGLRYGWLGYDGLRADEPDASADARPRGDRAPVAFVAELSAWVSVDGEASRAHGAEDNLRALLDDARVAAREVEPIALRSSTDRDAHRRQLSIVRESILDGEVYLVNVARVLHSDGPVRDEQLAARVARSRAPFAALLRGDGSTVAAMSMERALRWDRATRALETGPIKGTRPRDADPARDRALADELAASEKERAENVMAVDVHRNDLGRVAEAGSVKVASLCAVESHAFVHHLVSTVRAVAREGTTAREVLEAMLPVGSVTGAPKRAAMITIGRLELERRGLYTGVYGAIEQDGSMDLAVAIRTIVADAGGAHYGSGGGIVIDSDPEHEWRELEWKERALSAR